jgi:colicin import membrane protein
MAEIQMELVTLTGLDVVPDMSTKEGRYQVATIVFDTPHGVEKLVADIKAKVGAFVPDTTTDKGRKAIASMAHMVSKSKVFLDDLGKDLNAELKAKTSKVDADRKYARDELDTLRDATRAPLTEWEEAEKVREATAKLAAEIEAAHERALAENGLFNRTREIAAKEAELARIEAERVAKEEEAARIEAERVAAENAEAERLANEERIRKEAAELAQRAAEAEAAAAIALAERKEREAREAAELAERNRIAAEQKAEADKIAAAKRAEEEKAAAVREAEEKARLEAERVERERKAAEAAAAAKAERERKEAEMIAADVEHRRKVNQEAVKGLVAAGLTEAQAKTTLTAIIGGLVSHVTIKY